MKDLLLTLLHLAVMTAKLCGPGGVRAVIAENLIRRTVRPIGQGSMLEPPVIVDEAHLRRTLVAFTEE